LSELAVETKEVVNSYEGWDLDDDLPLSNIIRDRLGISSEIIFVNYTNMDSDLQTTLTVNADDLLNQFSSKTWDAEGECHGQADHVKKHY
jgi:hypothetical protein